MSSASLVQFGPRIPKIYSGAWASVKNLTAKMCQIVNNSAADCSISLKFYTGFGHVRPEVLQKFKVKGSKVKVIARYDVLA